MVVASARPAAALRPAPAPKPAARPLVATPRQLSLSVRTRANVVSDIGKYLSEAASQIFHPQTDCERLHGACWVQLGCGLPFCLSAACGTVFLKRAPCLAVCMLEQPADAASNMHMRMAWPLCTAAQAHAVVLNFPQRLPGRFLPSHPSAR